MEGSAEVNYLESSSVFTFGRPIVPERLSPLQTIAVICTKLDQGASEEKIRESLDLEDDLFSFCVEFALENNFVIKHEDGRYTITNSGKAFVSAFQQ